MWFSINLASLFALETTLCLIFSNAASKQRFALQANSASDQANNALLHFFALLPRISNALINFCITFQAIGHLEPLTNDSTFGSSFSGF